MATQRSGFGKPSEETKEHIRQTFFRAEFLTKHTRYLDQYFRYYEKELGKLGYTRFTQTQADLIIKSHADLITLVQKLQREGLSTRASVCNMLKVWYGANDDDGNISRALELVLRLWLMLNIREPDLQLQAGQIQPLVWGSNQLFTEFISQTFPVSRCILDAKQGRLSPNFTATFMVGVCGLQLEWTNCLADHLRLDRRAKRLRVFAFKSFIVGHIDISNHPGVNMMGSPLPEELLTETVWTLNLLFPQWDAETAALLEKHAQNFQRIGPYDGPPTLNLIEFKYWRDRMSELHDVIFLSPPASWAQLWKDRRNPQQFWTFWIALLILLLTVMSTIATIVQTWATVSSLSK